MNFKVIKRNYGHWDIWVNEERAFRIRGGPGKYWVVGENSYRQDLINFKTVQASMNYITDILMFELIVAEGQEPQTIESWNV